MMVKGAENLPQVLAVFQAIGADLDLFSMVFGESVMNDAVAIVLVSFCIFGAGKALH